MTAPTTEAPPAEQSAPEAANPEMTLVELLEQRGTVTDDHIAAGLNAVKARANELRAKAAASGVSEKEQAEASQLGEAYKSLTGEQARREKAIEDFSASLDGIPAAEDPERSTEESDGESESEGESEQQSEEEAKGEQPAATTASTTPAAPEPAKAPRLPLGTITRDQARPATANRGGQPTVSIVAAAGDAQKTTGESLTTYELYDAIDRRRRSIGRGHGGADDKVVVASIEAPRDSSRYLDRADELGNTRKIEAVTAPAALTAAGICAPYTIDYSIDAIGSTARPVKNAFPQYIADRGGVQFRRDVDSLGSGPISASGTWTLATDANPGEEDLKPLWDVPCNTVVSAEVQAVTYGLKFSNITNRFDPEAVAANTKAAAVAHARYAEMVLLNSMYSQVTATFTGAATVSAARDLLVALDKAQAYVRNNRRQGQEVTLRTFMPLWIKDIIRADMTRALHTSNEEWLAMTDAAIDQWFANRRINVTWMLDGRAAQSASGTGNTAVPALAAQQYAPVTGTNTLPGFPDSVEFPLFVEGTFVFLDGGSLDVGVVRDQALVQTNRYIQFQETFEGLYRKGVEAIRVVQGIQPTGGSASTVSLSSLTD